MLTSTNLVASSSEMLMVQLSIAGDVNFAAGAIGEFSADNVGGLVTNYTVNQNGAVNLQSGSIARFNLADVPARSI